MNKNKILGLVLVVVGVVTLLFQYNLLRSEGSFYVFGVLSSALIVLGIAALTSVNLADGQVTREDGTKANLTFKEMPTPMKVTVVLAIVAAAAQFAFFKFGPIL